MEKVKSLDNKLRHDLLQISNALVYIEEHLVNQKNIRHQTRLSVARQIIDTTIRLMTDNKEI